MPLPRTKKNQNLPFDNIAHKLLFGVLALGLLFILPLFGLPLEVGKQAFYTFFLLVVLVVFFLARLQDNSFILIWPNLGISSVAIVVSSLLSSFLAKTEFLQLPLFLGFVSLFLTGLYFNKPARVNAFFLTLFGLFLIILISTATFLIFGNFLKLEIFADRSVSLLGHFYDLPVFTGLVTVLSLAFIEFSSTRKGNPFKWFLRFVFVISLSVLALYNLFPVWLMVGFGALLILVYQLLFGEGVRLVEENGTARFSRGVLRPAFLVLFLSLLFLPFGRGQASLLSTGLSQISSFVGIPRPVEIVYPWSGLGKLIQDRTAREIFLGTGTGTFASEQLRVSPTVSNLSLAGEPRFPWGVGFWPRLALETGLVGLIAWAIFLAMFFGLFVRAVIQVIRLGSKSPLFLITLVGTLYLFVFNWFYSSGSALNFLTFFFLGLTLSETARLGLIEIKQREVLSGSPRVLFVIIFVLGIVGSVLIGYFSLQGLVARYYFEKAVAVSKVSGGKDIYPLLKGALDFDESDLYYRGLAEWGNLRLGELLASQTLGPDELRLEAEKVIQVATIAGGQAVKFNPKNVANWFTLGELHRRLAELNLDGAYDEALAAYTNALKLSPYDPNIFQSLALLSVEHKDYASARKYLEQSLLKQSDFTPALNLWLSLEESTGNLAQAIVLAERLTTLTPNDFLAWFKLGILRHQAANYEGSILAFERTVALNPVYANARYFLGLGYDKLNRQAEAISQFEKIKETNTDNLEVIKILDNLRRGEPALTEGQSHLKP